ncbi:MAG: YoaP domain-containing protein [Bacteroidales bacterium]|nr:YoaP domain-containing protein [Bacteroidales bacterium]
MAELLNPEEQDPVEMIDLTPENISDFGICGYKDTKKHLELRRKIEWFNRHYPKGLRIKIIHSRTAGSQGMIEYIPGNHAHRPVNAEWYMFIHCIWVGFKREFKHRGFASFLIDECVSESRNKNMKGVAVVTRKGAFMAGKHVFVKKGFAVVDRAEPDFELLALKFDEKTEDPKFIVPDPGIYNKGLTIFRSAQCPYSVKNVGAIIETARKLNIATRLVELNDSHTAQQTPCAFGTFCIVYNGEVLSHHPISNTRFENIMKAGE